jgi:hypothetical protein
VQLSCYIPTPVQLCVVQGVLLYANDEYTVAQLYYGAILEIEITDESNEIYKYKMTITTDVQANFLDTPK